MLVSLSDAPRRPYKARSAIQLINVTEGVGVLIKLDYSPLNYPPVMLIDQGTPNPQVPSVLSTLGCKLQKDLSDIKKSQHPFLYL